MKSILVIILTVLGSFFSFQAKAQTAEEILKTEQSIEKDGKYALLVMKPQHLKAAIKTGQTIKSQSSKADFQVVVCGELVKTISNDQELQKLITSAVQDQQLKILFCGMSIQQFDVDAEKLPAVAPVTANGLLYLFGLQEQGYKTIAL